MYDICPGVSVSHETYRRLRQYYDLLLKWQISVNLVGPSTIDNAWERHFIDSLQLLPHLQSVKSIVDIGTGAGFPGLAIAIASSLDCHLVESDHKKMLFLKEAARITQTPSLMFHVKRIEEIPPLKVDTIVSRACAPLANLFQLSEKQLHEQTTAIFHKGKNVGEEIKNAMHSWKFDYVTIPSVIDQHSVLLKLWNIRKRI